MEKRILSTEIHEEDVALESGLRPQYLSEYIGQEKVKSNLKVFIDAARMRGEALDHILLYGPPGLGKTTLSGIIANEMDVLFIDEIHRLNRQVEEVLYPAMEDYVIDVMIGKGPMAKSVRLELPKFTLVGATTRAGMLSAPLRDRFGVISKLEYYTERELMQIVIHSADKLNVSIDLKGAELLAMRSRGTPRLANRLLKRVRDFAQVQYEGMVNEEVVNTALDLLDVDSMGLDNTDQMMLQAMIERFHGGPVGLDTLAASIGEDSATIEDVYEPFLLQKGLLLRTPRGRVVTKAAYIHLGLEHLYKEEKE